MKLIIETVNNGFILTDESDDSLDNRLVFSFDYNELRTVVDLLNSIKDTLGYYGSKHDEERIFVRLEKQNDL